MWHGGRPGAARLAAIEHKNRLRGGGDVRRSCRVETASVGTRARLGPYPREATSGKRHPLSHATCRPSADMKSCQFKDDSATPRIGGERSPARAESVYAGMSTPRGEQSKTNQHLALRRRWSWRTSSRI